MWRILLAFIVMISGLLGNNCEKVMSKTISRKPIPTLFIHGFNGSDKSMSLLLKNLTGVKEQHYKRNGINLLYTGQGTTYYVNKISQVREFTFTNRNRNPLFVKVVFERNKSSLASQEGWLKTIVQKVKTKYKTDTINIVAHSMGGLTATRYIIDSYSKEKTKGTKNFGIAKVNKFISLSSPIKGIKKKDAAKLLQSKGGAPAIKDLRENSNEIKYIFKGKKNFDPRTKVLSIAGLKDSLVLKPSALGLKSFTKNFTYKEVNDYHRLQGNKKVAYFVKSFLVN